MDLLQPLPIEEWPLLQELFKRNWPTYAVYYNRIDNAIKWNKKDPNYARKIYCPNGKYHSGVFIEILSATVYHICVGTLNGGQDLLKNALIATNLIDWDKDIIFCAHDFVINSLIEAIDYLNKLKGVHITYVEKNDCYLLPKEKCAEIIVDVPEKCELRHLDKSHVPFIHSLWPHSSQDHPEITTKFLESFIVLNRGIGLFLKEDNSLVSWILQREYGPGILQTVEDQKRRGYGKIVTKALIKELAVEENLDSVVTVLPGNVPSEKLFTSLGYKCFATFTWIEVEKIK